jgi:hypothetical protein
MELQANADVVLGKPLSGVFPSGEDAWSLLFGPPQALDPTQAADSTARIVRVSQPVDLERKVGPV